MDECVRVLDHMPERNPTDGTFELTIRCNLHCKMCLFRHDDSENAEIMAKELTAEQWIDMARQVAEAGTLSLLITGGEPMLRPDFCEIWEGIYKQGFVITLYTNATLVTPKIMETLRKYPPHRIGVTIYGASPETYEKVTGSATAFERAIAGIKQLQSLPSQMEYRMTVIKDNYDDVDAVDELVKGLDPQGAVTTARMVHKPVRGGCADVESCRIPAEKNLFLFKRRAIAKFREKLGEQFDERNIRILGEEFCESKPSSAKSSLFGCGAGINSYVISWDGQLLGCQLIGHFALAVGQSFKDAWDRFPQGVRLPPISDKCSRCTMRSHCMSCPATRLAESGSFSEGSDYICKDTETVYRLLQKGD